MQPITGTRSTPFGPRGKTYYRWTPCRRLIRSALRGRPNRDGALVRLGRDLRDSPTADPSVSSGSNPDQTNLARPERARRGVLEDGYDVDNSPYSIIDASHPVSVRYHAVVVIGVPDLLEVDDTYQAVLRRQNARRNQAPPLSLSLLPRHRIPCRASAMAYHRH